MSERILLVLCPDFLSHQTFCLTGLFTSPDISSHRTFHLTRLFVSPDFSLRTQNTHPHALWQGRWRLRLLQQPAVSGQQGCSIKLPLPSQQDNANDCRGVAIAFAVELCHGIDASLVAYNKTGMRAHLSGFEEGKMKQFPLVKKHRRQPHVMKLQLSWVFGFCANYNESWNLSLYIKCNAHVSVCPFDLKVLHDWFHSWLLWDKPLWDKKSSETNHIEIKSPVRQTILRQKVQWDKPYWDKKSGETKSRWICCLGCHWKLVITQTFLRRRRNQKIRGRWDMPIQKCAAKVIGYLICPVTNRGGRIW